MAAFRRPSATELWDTPAFAEIAYEYSSPTRRQINSARESLYARRREIYEDTNKKTELKCKYEVSPEYIIVVKYYAMTRHRYL